MPKKELKPEDYWAQYIVRTKSDGKEYVYALVRRRYSDDDIESKGPGSYLGVSEDDRFEIITDTDPESDTFGKRVPKPDSQPVGKNLIQVCRTSPCWLRGSDKITDTICKQAKCGINETSEDNLFTVVEVECLGACSNGPMIQINNDFFEDLDQESTKQIIENIKNNIPNKIGSQKGRKSSENA